MCPRKYPRKGFDLGVLLPVCLSCVISSYRALENPIISDTVRLPSFHQNESLRQLPYSRRRSFFRYHTPSSERNPLRGLWGI